MRNYLIILLLSSLSISCSEPPAKPTLHRTVISVDVQSYDGTSEHILPGITQSAETSQLSFEISGIVKAVNVNLGDTFKQGDVLATIQPKVFSLAVKQRQGQLSEVNARLHEAQLDFTRKKQLLSSGSVSQATLDVANAQLTSLKDQVAIAQAQLELAQEDLADTRLIAPYAGTVAQRFIEPSQRITPAEPAFSIQGNGGMEVSVLAPENLVNRLHVGDDADVTVFAVEETQISGKIFEVGSQAQSANAFPVTVRLDDAFTSLQPGMSAEVRFNFRTTAIPANTFTIPLSALGASDNNTHFVWKIVQADANAKNAERETQTVTRQNVTVLSLDENTALIQGELTAGTQIVRSGVAFLKEGEAVRLASGKPRLYNE